MNDTISETTLLVYDEEGIDGLFQLMDSCLARLEDDDFWQSGEQRSGIKTLREVFEETLKLFPDVLDGE